MVSLPFSVTCASYTSEATCVVIKKMTKEIHAVHILFGLISNRFDTDLSSL